MPYRFPNHQGAMHRMQVCSEMVQTQTTKRQEPSRNRFRPRIQGRTTRNTLRAQYGMSRVKPHTPTHLRLRALRKQLRPRYGARARPRRRRRPSFGRGGLRRLLRLRFQSTSAPSNQYRIPALHFVEEVRRRRSSSSPCRAWSARAAGRTMPPGASRRGRASLHLSLRCESSPWRPAGDEGGGFVSLSGFPQKARERNGSRSRSRSLRGFAFCFFMGGKMERWRSLWGFNFIERCWPTCQLHIRRKLSLSLEGIPDTDWIFCSCL